MPTESPAAIAARTAAERVPGAEVKEYGGRAGTSLLWESPRGVAVLGFYDPPGVPLAATYHAREPGGCPGFTHRDWPSLASLDEALAWVRERLDA